MKAGDFVDNGIWLAQGTVEGWTAKEYNRGCKGCSRSQKLGGGLGEDEIGRDFQMQLLFFSLSLCPYISASFWLCGFHFLSGGPQPPGSNA